MQIFASCIGIQYNALTEQECNNVVAVADTCKEEDAKVLSPQNILTGQSKSFEETESYNEEQRKTKLLHWNGHEDLIDRIGAKVTRHVQDYLSTVPIDINPSPSVQFAKYSSEGDKFEWHCDQEFNWKTWDIKHQIDKNQNKWHFRKVTAICQVSNPDDYKGCNLEFRHHKHEDDNPYRDQGTLIIFPSFVYHRVTPLLSGKRFSLTYWYEGPVWR